MIVIDRWPNPSEVWTTPPTLDARTAYAVNGFLFWLVVTLHRLHHEFGPFDSLVEVLDAAQTSIDFLERKDPGASNRLPKGTP